MRATLEVSEATCANSSKRRTRTCADSMCRLQEEATGNKYDEFCERREGIHASGIPMVRR